VDLINRLLTKDKSKRLGAGPNGLEDILNHPFFSDIDLDAIENKQIEASFKPTISEELTELDLKKFFNTETIKNENDVHTMLPMETKWKIKQNQD